MGRAPREESADKRKSSAAGRLTRLFLVLGAALLLTRCSGVVESMAYFPSRDPFNIPAGTEDVWFQSADGTKLHGWFMPALGSADGDAPRPAILHAHGNAGNVSSHESFSRFLTREGFHVFIFDYRGYGRSDDKSPRRAALLEDTQAALAALRARNDVDPDRLGVYGVSLGGVFALHAAAQDQGVSAVATISTFSTWKGVANDMLPALGWFLMPGGLDPADATAKLGDRPYLIVHGLVDEIINPRHANNLQSAARDAGVDVTLWTDPQGDHNTLVQTNPEARQAIAAFFKDRLDTSND